MDDLKVLIIGAIFAFALLPFIFRNNKRPENCTCKKYNWLTMGPVDNCEAHKHMADER